MDTFTTKDGVQIFYKDWGNGQPVVFHHGWPLSADDWDAQMMHFLMHGYRVIAHDRRGHGRSEQVRTGNDIEHWVADLAALTEQLDLHEAVHIGHSTGGAEVARYVARHQERVAKAVLVSSPTPNMVRTDNNPGGQPQEWFDAVQAGFGRLDGVVINAGIVAAPLPLADISADRLKRIFETNVYGAYLCAREAARRLRGNENGGAVVIVSSAAARLGSPFEYVDYAGSKAALDALTIGLSKELGRDGVRVNAVRPGLIDTDIHASGGQPDRAHRLGQETPMGRCGRPEEVAEAIAWLLSDAASYVTGSILDVTGGR